MLNKITTKFFFSFYCLFIFCNYADVSQRIIQIGFEGMPGAGKTSILVSLGKEIGEGCLFLPEINIEEGSFLAQEDDIWMEYHDLWKERLSILKKAKDNLVVFMDRTYFTNLAFTYAFSSEEKPQEYEMQKEIIKNDFQETTFDVIFFFDTSPELGLQRRNLQGDFPPYPWSSISFLERLREFYYKELPKLYSGKIVYISTDVINQEQLSELVCADILKRFEGKVVKNSLYSNLAEEETMLLDYASKHKELGFPYSQGFCMMGFPTIYFRQFAIQLEGQNIFILNNDRLNQILDGKK